MNTHLFNIRAITAGALLSIVGGGCASTHSGNAIEIAEQGSFFVGGRTVQAPGVYDPTKSAAGTDEGQIFWVDQMYVQYQVPVNARKYPLVLVHGGSGTGRV